MSEAAAIAPIHHVNVFGSKMHYARMGKGQPVVFIHGMPTSSYVWRHILPIIAKNADCIAVDLIGMGLSDKPDIKYSIHDHIKYFTGFIDGLKLKDVALVMHGWGSVIGLSYASQHEKNISSLAVVEGYVHVPPIEELPLPVLELAYMSRDRKKLERLIIEENYFVEKLLPSITLKKISQDVLDEYAKPFKEKKNRRVIYQFMLDQPFYNPKSAERKLIDDYSAWLQQTSIRKLLMYAIPGFLTPMSTVSWAIDHLPNLTVVELGEGLHYLPETRAQEIAQTLSGWL
jgi:haloalkane dehalogenase